MVEAIIDDEALLEEALDRIPLTWVGQPHEIASAVAFLASDEAAWITGIRWTAARPPARMVD